MGSKLRKQRKSGASKVLEHLPLISSALKSKDRKLKAVLLSNPDVINTISSVARNTIAGHIPIKCEKLKKKVFGRYRKDLERLGNSNKTLSSQRIFLRQRGAGLFSVVAALVPFAISALSSLVRKG